MTSTSTIERLPDESNRAYAARIEYVTAGPQRSLEALAQKYNKSRSLFARWSTQYDWQATAEGWDNQQAAALINEAADAYRADLADYRRRYGDMGKALYGSAAKMLKKINATLDTSVQLNPGSLLTVLNAAKTAADLEALALRVEHLLNNEPGSE